MKEILKSGLILFIITAVAGVLLGFVYEITKAPIEIQEKMAQEKAMKTVLPSAVDFQVVYTAQSEDENISLVQKGLVGSDLAGFVFNVNTSGFGGKIELMVGLDTNGTLTGMTVLKHNETPGLGAEANKSFFAGQFIGKDKFPLSVIKTPAKKDSNEIQAITSATITSEAITRAVNEVQKWFVDNKIGG